MRESPILFSAPMVRAILDGRKIQTRRVMKIQPHRNGPFWQVYGAGWGGDRAPARPGYSLATNCPFGQVGDRLWVREAWRVPASLDDMSGKQIVEKCIQAGYSRPWCPIQYEADGARTSERDWREFGSHPGTPAPGRYRHARFMPRWATRTILEATEVFVERLQAISEHDACREGVGMVLADDFPLEMTNAITRSRAEGFRYLWESINGAGSWDANPWVWAIEFKRIEVSA